MQILVTGASSGFGTAISQTLVQQGHTVYGLARRSQKLQQLKQQLGENFHPICADLTQFDASILPKQIDVLINNAGLALGLESADQANLADWHTMINTNITAVVTLTHAVLPLMVKQGVGTIINLGSTAGRYAYAGANVYGASKAFISQFSDNLRTDLAGKNIRVTTLAPGLCSGTEFSNIRFKGDNERAKAVYDDVDAITPQDIANTISWLIHLPQHVNVNYLEVMPTCQNSAGLSVTKKHIG